MAASADWVATLQERGLDRRLTKFLVDNKSPFQRVFRQPDTRRAEILTRDLGRGEDGL